MNVADKKLRLVHNHRAWQLLQCCHHLPSMQALHTSQLLVPMHSDRLLQVPASTLRAHAGDSADGRSPSPLGEAVSSSASSFDGEHIEASLQSLSNSWHSLSISSVATTTDPEYGRGHRRPDQEESISRFEEASWIDATPLDELGVSRATAPHHRSDSASLADETLKEHHASSRASEHDRDVDNANLVSSYEKVKAWSQNHHTSSREKVDLKQHNQDLIFPRADDLEPESFSSGGGKDSTETIKWSPDPTWGDVPFLAPLRSRPDSSNGPQHDPTPPAVLHPANHSQSFLPDSRNTDRSLERQFIEKHPIEHSHHHNVSNEYTDWWGSQSQQSSQKIVGRQLRRKRGMKAQPQTSRTTREYERALARYWIDRIGDTSQDASATLSKVNPQSDSSKSQSVEQMDLFKENYKGHRKG